MSDQKQQQQVVSSGVASSLSKNEHVPDINDFNDDEGEVPLMSEDETVQEFLEYARYDDEGAEERIATLATANPKLFQELDINSGRSALHMAVSNGYLHLVKAMVSLPGCDVNIRTKGTLWTPLHDAVVNNRVEIVALLLSRGANPVAKNDTDESPIELAEKLGREEISALLLKADSTIESYQTENGKITMDIDESEIDNSAITSSAASATVVETTSSSTSGEGKKNLDVDDVE